MVSDKKLKAKKMKPECLVATARLLMLLTLDKIMQNSFRDLVRSFRTRKLKKRN